MSNSRKRCLTPEEALARYRESCNATPPTRNKLGDYADVVMAMHRCKRSMRQIADFLINEVGFLKCSPQTVSNFIKKNADTKSPPPIDAHPPLQKSDFEVACGNQNSVNSSSDRFLELKQRQIEEDCNKVRQRNDKYKALSQKASGA